LSKIGTYQIYNGFALTHLIKRLKDILEQNKYQLEEGFRDHDNEDTGEIPITSIIKVISSLGFTDLDSDILDFIKYISLYNSESLSKVNYYTFLEIFDDDYLIGTSLHFDPRPFIPSPSETTEGSDAEPQNPNSQPTD
jgi:hypothetical protein